MNTTGPNTPDGGRSQAQSEIASGKGPSLTHTWHPTVQDAYLAERARLEAERNTKKTG